MKISYYDNYSLMSFKEEGLSIYQLAPLRTLFNDQNVKNAIIQNSLSWFLPYEKFITFENWEIEQDARRKVIQTNKKKVNYIIPLYAKLGYHQKIDNINIGFDTEFNYESVGLNYYINHRIEKTGEIVKNQNVFKVRSNLQNFKYSIKLYANYEINNWNISSSIYLKYRLSTQDISIDEVTDHFVLNKAYLIKFLIMNYGLKLGIAKDDYIKGITHELLVNPKFKVSYTYNMEQFKLIPSVTLSMNYYKFDKDYIIKIFSNELTEKEAKEGFIKPIKAQNINLKENIIYLDYSIKPELTCSYEINKNVEIFANGGADFTMKPVKLNGKNTHELNAKGIGSLGLNFKW